jgi:magnesium transporter
VEVEALDNDHDENSEQWPRLSPRRREEIFTALSRVDSEELFLSLSAADQAELLPLIPVPERRSYLRMLAYDDATDLIQNLPPEERENALSLLDAPTRRDVSALLAYAEDEAGGLMNSSYVRLRPEMTVDEAITYLRAQALTQVETIYYAYVMAADQRLVGVLSFRDLFLAPPSKKTAEIMKTDLVTIPEEMHQEEVSRMFSQHNLMAIPVVDNDGRMKGIVTVDDIVSVVQEEATAAIQRIGGLESLDAPYFQLSFLKMLKKRAGWLTLLFLGEMLTATAMGYYEKEIEKAVVLALFIPLIISSGGNSGSQATTIIIRSMSLAEVTLKDWLKVLGRELASGLALGGILGSIGLIRILLWPSRMQTYGEHFLRVGLTVAISLLGIVLWGTVMGSMLPFVLRRLGFDPASASAPLVATLVDVTGLIIYFSVASVVLHGVML